MDSILFDIKQITPLISVDKFFYVCKTLGTNQNFFLLLGCVVLLCGLSIYCWTEIIEAGIQGPPIACPPPLPQTPISQLCLVPFETVPCKSVSYTRKSVSYTHTHVLIILLQMSLKDPNPTLVQIMDYHSGTNFRSWFFQANLLFFQSHFHQE